MPKVIVSLALLVLASGLVAGCGKSVEPTVHQDVLAKADLQYYWGPRDLRGELGLARSEKFQKLMLLDEVLYVMTSKNRLIAIDAASGLVKWSRLIEDKGKQVFEPFHANGVSISPDVPGIAGIVRPETETDIAFDAVLINTLTRLLVLDRNDKGKVIRDIDLGFPASASGSSDSIAAYLPGANGWYYSVDLNTGIKLWWLATEGRIVVPPQVYLGRLYVASADSTVRCAVPEDTSARLAWTQQTMSPMMAPMAVDSRGVFAAGDDGRIYGFQTSGPSLWPQALVTNGRCREATRIGQNSLFQYSEGDAFYVVDIANGTARWTSPQGRQVLTVIDQTVYMVDSDRYLRLVNEMTGEEKATVPLSGFNLFADNVKVPGAFVGSRDGLVALIRPVGASHLSDAMLRAKGSVKGAPVSPAR